MLVFLASKSNIAVFKVFIKLVVPLPKVNEPSALAVHKPQASYELPDANLTLTN